MSITRVIVLQTPATLQEVVEFVDECMTLSNDGQSQVRVFGRDMRFKWPPDSPVDEGNLAKGSGGKE